MPIAERLSADEYLAREDPRRTELLHGVAVVHERTFLHQQALGAILTALRAWTRERPGRGVVSPPLDLRLDDENVLAPDVLWFRDPVPRDAPRAPRVPDLVVEVRSPSTWVYDVGRKRALYEQHGVRELWLADTRSESILVYRRRAERSGFDDELELSGAEPLTSPLLPGFAVPVAELFEV